jgi:hypothetical protein
VHALLVLDEPQDEVALLEGASADSATVVVAEPLLVDRVRERAWSCASSTSSSPFWRATSLLASV